jgi:transcriptional regulator with XRE-family HTH domain
MSELHKKFGSLLKLERERKNLRLEDLSSQLKITQSNLEYLEAGDVASLPSEIYYNLFAKSYAEALGIDFSRTIEAIREELDDNVLTEPRENKADSPGNEETKTVKAAQPELESKSAGSTAPLKKFVGLFAAILVVFIIFVMVAKFFFGGETLQETARSVIEKTTAELQNVSAPDENNAAAEYDWKVPEYQKPAKISLTLKARDDSWSTVVADGDTVLFRNLVPGQVWSLEAEYRMLVSVGIPSLVDIELNGRMVDLSDSVTGRVSRVEINQMNIDRYVHPPSSETTTSDSSTGAPDQPNDTGGTISVDDTH